MLCGVEIGRKSLVLRNAIGECCIEIPEGGSRRLELSAHPRRFDEPRLQLGIGRMGGGQRVAQTNNLCFEQRKFGDSFAGVVKLSAEIGYLVVGSVAFEPTARE